jgi:uncharacterized protein (DUF2249 family)
MFAASAQRRKPRPDQAAQTLICIKASRRPRIYVILVMKHKFITLDVREDIRRGREPFSRIMQAVASLKPDESLRLLAPFEPKPLFGVLAQQGFSNTATQTAAGDWEVFFTRSPHAATVPAAASASAPAPTAACSGTPVLDVDARGLEPPQPLVKILETVTSLPRGARLRARTDRRPMHLYAQLESRGFVGESEEQPDGSFITYIRHASDANKS